MADINHVATLLGQIKGKLRERTAREQELLEDIAGKALDAYRAALGDDFTTQEVINASHHGFQVKNWDSLDPEIQYTLSALCARHSESIDRERVSSILSDGVVGYLREHGLPISDEQAHVFPDLMKDIMNVLEQAGVKFSNDVRQARILGLIPLVDYKNWLVDGGQYFMDIGQYSSEIKLTDNAIKANQDILTTALVAARDIKVGYAMLRSERIEGIVKADSYPLGQDSLFVVTYETNDGKKGEIDVLRASLTSLTEEADTQRINDLLHKKKIRDGGENLGYGGSIASLVGLPESISAELRANVWRKYLKRFGVDFSKNAEVVLVDPTKQETVSFFYATKNYKGEENGVMVAFRFDERYTNSSVYVCPRDDMQEEISRAESIRDRFRSDYKPLLEPMAVRVYVENRRRLTEGRP